jgi:hypothetical protein
MSAANQGIAVSDVGANSEVGAGVVRIIAIHLVSTGVLQMYFISEM